MQFTCPRTCRTCETVDICRFMPILKDIGNTLVNSHTAQVAVAYENMETLQLAVAAMGGQWLGQGTHKLFSSSVNGMGFRLPGWNYPLVAAGGKLSYDNYNGHWGNEKDLERLKGEYAIATAVQSANALGWTCERQGAGLVIHHPSGGQLTINGIDVAASGFTGEMCHAAAQELGLKYETMNLLPEYGQVANEIQITDQ